jgi:hypothetical protein
MKKRIVPRSGIDTGARWWATVIPRKDGFLNTRYI